MLYAEKVWKIRHKRNKEKDQRQEYWMWKLKRKAITSSLLLVPANKSASLLTFVIRIVPPSLCKKPSPSATAVVPLEVPPSIRLISAAVVVIAVALRTNLPSPTTT